MTTQKQNIMAHLRVVGSITPREALYSYGCFRLGARIHELRVAGYRIDTEREQDGRSCYARYVMEGRRRA